jgi:hypothetical protein
MADFVQKCCEQSKWVKNNSVVEKDCYRDVSNVDSGESYLRSVHKGKYASKEEAAATTLDPC